MSEFSLRQYGKEDIPAMKAVWAGCFSDPEEYIDAFISLLPGVGTAVVAEYEGRVCGNAYIIDDMLHISNGASSRCALIYAVGVEASCRRLGMGGAIVRQAVELAKERGSSTVTILPAEASLYGWYKACAGFDCRLYRKEVLIETADLAMAEPVSPEVYASKRESLISQAEYIRFGAGAMKLAEALFRIFGGGLYRCAGSLAAGYKDDDGTGVIHELLCPAGHDRELVAAAVGFEMGCDKVKLLLPADESDRGKYLAAVPGGMSADCYWPFAYD